VIGKKIDLNFLSKPLAMNILKNIVDIILSCNLTKKALKNLKNTIVKLLNFVEISNDGKVIYELSTRLLEYSKLDFKERRRFYNGVIAIFKSIIASESIIPSNSVLIFKLLLESTNLMLVSIFDRLKNLNIKANIDILIEEYIVC
jgi:hypothetical protein